MNHLVLMINMVEDRKFTFYRLVMYLFPFFIL